VYTIVHEHFEEIFRQKALKYGRSPELSSYEFYLKKTIMINTKKPSRSGGPSLNPQFLLLNWPAPKNIHAASTTRLGGYSQPPFDQFNLALHVNDHTEAVFKNRALLKTALQLPSEPIWLEQQHGQLVVDAHQPDTRYADAAYTDQPNVVCIIMTADCMPILMCNEAGSEIAAIHAGWRGLHQEIIRTALQKFKTPAHHLMAWLGPTITQKNFEVSESVRDDFIALDSQNIMAFKDTLRPNHYLLDLYDIAKRQLMQLGVQKIYADSRCTFEEKDRFYSYRRSPQTGRMASLIWMETP